MEVLSERVQSKWAIGVIGLVLGIGLGIVYGWYLDPVEWTNATPSMLRDDLRADYLRMAIESYSINKNADLAKQRYERLGEYAQTTLRQVAQQPGEISTTAIQSYSAVIEILTQSEAEPEVEATSPSRTAEAGSQQVQAADTQSSSAARFLMPVCGTALLLGLAFVVLLAVRNRTAGEDEDEQGTYLGRLSQPGGVEPYLEPAFDMNVEYAPAEAEELDYTPEGDAPEEPEAAEMGQVPVEAPEIEALATFRTIYSMGDDLYDDSFSIESAAGDFLGECGVGIGDVIGVGDPKKVSAFEVWLFDKNDIQTVTKVLMSRYTYSDEETRSRLAAKGDPVEAENGGVVFLETESLMVEARIVDMSYGQSALPQESFFERMTIELRALPKAG